MRSQSPAGSLAVAASFLGHLTGVFLVFISFFVHLRDYVRAFFSVLAGFSTILVYSSRRCLVVLLGRTHGFSFTESESV
jgi:hypothetical protein